MTTLKTVEDLLPTLTRSEKAQLLQQIACEIGDTYRGIEFNSGVNSGDPIFAHTRIPVWLLVQARQSGATEADLLYDYPTVRAEDLFMAWSYYRIHKAEIDSQIRANRDS